MSEIFPGWIAFHDLTEWKQAKHKNILKTFAQIIRIPICICDPITVKHAQYNAPKQCNKQNGSVVWACQAFYLVFLLSPELRWRG